jgi:hypothetical protein
MLNVIMLSVIVLCHYAECRGAIGTNIIKNFCKFFQKLKLTLPLVLASGFKP